MTSFEAPHNVASGHWHDVPVVVSVLSWPESVDLIELPKTYSIERRYVQVVRTGSGTMPTEGTFQFGSFDSMVPRAFAEDAEWLSNRVREIDDGTVFHLPTRHELQLRNLYCLSETEWRSEAAFADDCARFHAIGIRSRSFVRYRHLADELPSLSTEMVPSPADLGWNTEFSQRLTDLRQFVDGIGPRMKAAAGRLVSMPSFLAHRDRLWDAWNKLADSHRPEFPLCRSPRVSCGLDGFSRLSRRTKLARFLTDFDQFCDEWAVQELASWHLPMPDGPHWPARALPTDSNPDTCETTIRTPWHFPVCAADGLGDLLRNEHQRSLQDRGINDEAHYGSYAHLLEIDHWERVLTQRYRNRRRPNGFVTQLIGVIASTIGLDAERVAKLRKALRALKAGSRNSLKGFR